jgi:hypothetical protein
MLLPKQFPYEVVLKGQSPKNLEVEELANYLRDLVFLHDRLVRMSDPEYSIEKLSNSFFYVRGGRSVDTRFRLRLTHIRQESPFELGLLIGALLAAPAAGWGFFQIVRGCMLLRGDRRLQRQQVEQNEISRARQLMELHRDFPPPRERHELWSTVCEVHGADAPTSKVEAAYRLVDADIRRLNAGIVEPTELEIKRELDAEQLKELAKGAGGMT